MDTGQTRSFRVAAYTEDRAAQRGAGQQDVHDDVKDDNQNEADLNAANTLAAQPHNAIREAGNHRGAGYQQRHAPEEVLHTKGGYEGVGEVQAGQQQAVDQADQAAADDNGNDNNERVINTAQDEHTADTGAEHCVRTNRKVDTGGDQAEQHADCQHSVKSCLIEYVHQVVHTEETAAGDYGQDGAQKNQRNQYAELAKITLFLCLSHLKYLPMLLS